MSIFAVSSRDRALRSSLFSLYSLQAANYLFPLITVPYLARVLAPAGWGLVAFAQAFGYLLQVLIEYGFHLSATRTVAQQRHSVEARAGILSGVLAAKALLVLALALLVLAIGPLIPHLSTHPRLLWGALIWAAGQAFSMTWYFQGLERMAPAVAAELSANCISTVAILLLVRQPEDGWMVLPLQGSALLIAAASACGWACREIRIGLPGWAALADLFRSAWPLFSYRGALVLYSTGNPFVLGLLAPVSSVGYFGGADRIARAFVALVNPMSQALYPRISYLAPRSTREADRFARVALALAACIGLATGTAVWLGARVWVRLLLGPEFQPAVPVLRVLALLCPLISVNTVLALLWLLPRYLDARLNYVTLLAGAVNLALALFLAPRGTHVGMA